MSKVINISHKGSRNENESATSLADPELIAAREAALNQMCSTLVAEENKRSFRAFPESYCRHFDLSLEQIHAVTDLDISRLLKLGSTLTNLERLISIYNLDVVELCTQQTGKTLDEVIKHMAQS